MLIVHEYRNHVLTVVEDQGSAYEEETPIDYEDQEELFQGE